MSDTEEEFLDMAAYRASAREREARRRQEQEQRRERALAVAHQAAIVLREQFGASRVILFGSLARGGPFDQHSDVDLAVWGLTEASHYRAISWLLDLDATIEIDVVRGEEATQSLLEVITSEGVAL